MKTLEEIKKILGLVVAETAVDGGCGLIYRLDPKKPNTPATVVWSNGGGWDHVSVAFGRRCPTWDEMCIVKKAFFHPEEICVEFHPPESEYVDQHPYCLHLWRYQQPGMPMPPSWMIGLKKGQTISDVLGEVKTYYAT